MAKYAVFIDDGLDSIFDNYEYAKDYAANVREMLRSEGNKDRCYVQNLTKEEEEMFTSAS